MSLFAETLSEIYETNECPICLINICDTFSKCNHSYCKNCLALLDKCAICREPFNDIPESESILISIFGNIDIEHLEREREIEEREEEREMEIVRRRRRVMCELEILFASQRRDKLKAKKSALLMVFTASCMVLCSLLINP